MMMNNEYLKLFLDSTDDELAELIVPIEKISGLDEFKSNKYGLSRITTFHPIATRMVIKDDGYYLGSRANHFVLLFGYTEHETWPNCIMLLTNHKGWLDITMFGLKAEVLKKEIFKESVL